MSSSFEDVRIPVPLAEYIDLVNDGFIPLCVIDNFSPHIAARILRNDADTVTPQDFPRYLNIFLSNSCTIGWSPGISLQHCRIEPLPGYDPP
jgi:hypothetical protein